MTDLLDALDTSVARLRGIVEPLTPDQLRASAYPSEWSIADVLSHVGSGAVIMQARLEAALDGREVADDFAPPIWAEWNAKPPEAQASDALAVDRAFVERARAVTPDQRETLRVPLGPMVVTFAELVGFRLNEHVLHTWDVEVALEPAATLPVDAATFVIDRLGMIVQFGGKPTGAVRDVHVHTTDPERDFVLAFSESGLALSDAAAGSSPDLALPAEAFIRLVYGRLDADPPTLTGSADVDELRRAFSGV